MAADLIQETSSTKSIPFGYALKTRPDGKQYYAIIVEADSGEAPPTPGVDREIASVTYRVKTAFTGASVGDTVTSLRVLDLSSGVPVQDSLTWFNDSTSAPLADTPAAANLEPVASGGITNAQMAALLAGMSTAALQTTGNTAIATMSGKLPATLGGKTAALSLSVTPATDANLTRETYATVTIMTLLTGAAGAWVLFGNQACSSLDIVNNSGADILYRRNGAGEAMVIPTGTSRLVQGITNANQIGVTRVDGLATVATVKAEAFAV